MLFFFSFINVLHFVGCTDIDYYKHITSVDPQRCSVTGNAWLVEFLLQIIMCCHAELYGCHHSADDLRCHGGYGKRSTLCLCELACGKFKPLPFLGSVKLWKESGCL